MGRVVESEMFGEPAIGGGGFLRERGEAEGVFSQMGFSRVDLEWVVSLEMAEDELVYVLVGVFRSVSANGDFMEGTFWSRQNASGLVYDIEVTVTGGSGRFEGAQAIVAGNGFREGDAFSYFLDGWIEYGESKRD